MGTHKRNHYPLTPAGDPPRGRDHSEDYQARQFIDDEAGYYVDPDLDVQEWDQKAREVPGFKLGMEAI